MAAKTLIDGRYELDDLPLARGGMGEVWTGRDVKLEREVAVKFIRFPDGQHDEELVRRLVRESRVTARLEHPGVPAVYDVGTHDGRPYLVMQRIRGISVADLNAEHAPLPIGWAAAIAAQTCSVLAVAHRASLVHRDLKPDNLMLDPDGGVKVLDFGLAVALDMGDHSQITRTGQTLGTPAYMAPEQIMASMSGPRTDLYALGCTFFEMLCGHTPFDGSTAYAVMSQQVEQRPRAPRAARPQVPVGLEHLVLALLEKRPDDRPESAEIVYQGLLPYIDELGPLPGTLAAPAAPSAARMYAGVLSRVLADPIAAPIDAGDAEHAEGTSAGYGHAPRFSRSELDQARARASALVGQSRYSQAAEVLATVVEPASRVLGNIDDDVISLRGELTNVLFECGDYPRAAAEHRQLARDFAARHGPDTDRVLHHRLQEATCHALVGDTMHALEQLEALLPDQRRLLGDDDPRNLELRRQIGLLQLGAGQHEQAEQTLTGLLDDLTRHHGPDHASVSGVRDLLASISL